MNMKMIPDLGDVPVFDVVPTRWIVERPLSCVGRQRQVSKYNERQAGSADAFIDLVGTCLLL
jgi:hypothetical protein